MASDFPNKDVLYEVMEQIVAAPAVLAPRFQGLSVSFEKGHREYAAEVEREMRDVFALPEIKKPLELLHVDWLTAHYYTRHRAARGEARAWIQVGIAIAPELEGKEDLRAIYRDVVPPYFQGMAGAGRQTPLLVNFVVGDNALADDESGIVVAASVVEMLKQRTTANRYESEPFSEADVKLVDSLQTGLMSQLEKPLGDLVGRRVVGAEALELLRNSCRATLLGLKKDLTIGFELPRFAIICPSYVGESIIGGSAYIGPGPMSTAGVKPLAAYSDIVLSRLRLLEEPVSDAAATRAEALNMARGSYLQRMAHAIRDPLEALRAATDETVQRLTPVTQDLQKGVTELREGIGRLSAVEERVKDLQKSAAQMMLALARGDIETLLHGEKRKVELADLLRLVRFLYEPSFRQEGKRLDVQEVPVDWYVWLDRTAILEVIGNMLTNALRYGTSVTLEVERIKRHGATYYQIRVRDDGKKGVDPSVEKRLFTTPGIYAEEVDSHTSAIKARGFGLYFGSGVAQAHGGRLYLEPRTAGETVFVLELPEGPPAEPLASAAPSAV